MSDDTSHSPQQGSTPSNEGSTDPHLPDDSTRDIAQSEGSPQVQEVISNPGQGGRDSSSSQTRSLLFVQVRQRLEELKGELLSVLDVLDARVRRILEESQRATSQPGQVPPWKREYKFNIIALEDLGMEERGDSCPICYAPFLEFFRDAVENRPEADKAPILVGLARLDCRHLFCLRDITTWTKSGESSCPSCRSPIPYTVLPDVEVAGRVRSLDGASPGVSDDNTTSIESESAITPSPDLSGISNPATTTSETLNPPQPQSQVLSDSYSATSTALNNLRIPQNLPDTTAAELRAAIDEARERISELFADVEQRVVQARAEVAERERERERLSLALDVAREGLRNARRLAISATSASNLMMLDVGFDSGEAQRRMPNMDMDTEESDSASSPG